MTPRSSHMSPALLYSSAAATPLSCNNAKSLGTQRPNTHANNNLQRGFSVLPPCVKVRRVRVC